MERFSDFSVTFAVTYLQNSGCDVSGVCLTSGMLFQKVIAKRRLPPVVLGVPQVLVVADSGHPPRLPYVGLFADRTRQQVYGTAGVASSSEAGGAGMTAGTARAGWWLEG